MERKSSKEDKFCKARILLELKEDKGQCTFNILNVSL